MDFYRNMCKIVFEGVNFMYIMYHLNISEVIQKFQLVQIGDAVFKFRVDHFWQRSTCQIT